MKLTSWRVAYERFMECVAVVLLSALAVIVVVGVVFRYAGDPLPWYNEVASVALAWLTYYGTGLAALKRAHIAIPNAVNALPTYPRLAVTLFAEACVLTFLGLLTWYGWYVLGLIAGQTLVTVDIPVTVTQSAIPIGSGLFIVAELMMLPQVIAEALRERDPEKIHHLIAEVKPGRVKG